MSKQDYVQNKEQHNTSAVDFIHLNLFISNPKVEA